MLASIDGGTIVTQEGAVGSGVGVGVAGADFVGAAAAETVGGVHPESVRTAKSDDTSNAVRFRTRIASPFTRASRGSGHTVSEPDSPEQVRDHPPK
jgi:hypothetical protein